MKDRLLKNLDLIFVDSEIGELMNTCSESYCDPTGGTVWFYVRSREDRPVWRVSISFDKVDEEHYNRFKNKED